MDDQRDLTVARPKSPIFTVKLSSCRNMLLDLRSLEKKIFYIDSFDFDIDIDLWMIFLAWR